MVVEHVAGAQAFVHSVQVFAGTGTPAQVAGTSLTALTTGDTDPAPSAPTGLVATAGNGQVGLSWTAVTGATSYTVLENGSPVGTTASPSDAVTGLTNGTSYSFTVSAANGGGSSTPSAPVTATPEPPAPSAPTGLVATAGNGQVGLSWTAVTGATSYTVLENGSPVGTTASPSDAVTGLTNGTSYSFTVSAANGGGSSTPSAPVTATPVDPVPAAPTGLTTSDVTADGATLSWTPSAGATGYTVLAGGTVVATSTTPTAVVTGLLPGTPYSLYVTASDPGGTSAPSGSTPIVTTPGTPALTVKAAVATLTFVGDTGTGGPAWTVLDDGDPMTGVTYTISGSDVTATIRGLTHGTAYSFSVRGTSGGVVSPATTPVNYLTRSVPAVTTSGTEQTLTWSAVTTGMTWKVEGCSSTRVRCSGTTAVSTGAVTQTGQTVTTTVSGCSPALHYRYRVIGTDPAMDITAAGPMVSAGPG